DLIKKAEEKLSLICAESVMLEDYMRKASLKCHGDGEFVALHEKYLNLFKDPISFKDDGNGDNVGDDDDDENGDDDDGNVDEEYVNEGDKDPNESNLILVLARLGDLFGDNSVTKEVMNQGLLTPERMLTSVSNVSPSPEKQIVKPSCYMLSPYMNKKTKVVPKIKRLEFILGNSLFAMEGDKM
ncbi:hypothetical protein Tco_1545442, partial [Tanacetum coccineum]